MVHLLRPDVQMESISSHSLVDLLPSLKQKSLPRMQLQTSGHPGHRSHLPEADTFSRLSSVDDSDEAFTEVHPQNVSRLLVSVD